MNKLKFLDLKLAKEPTPIVLKEDTNGQRVVHIFDEKMIHAVNAALASGRPLLIRGEPGVGKSQLAWATAVALGRQFLQYTVDIRSEAQDLMWQYDAVRRLAEAQIINTRKDLDQSKVDKILAEQNFLRPGPLWWAFHWENAEKFAGEQKDSYQKLTRNADPKKNGCVLLIDEIDKAETDVPNGLLEALGARRFVPLNKLDAVEVQEPFPLVMITTNEERALPNAFIRRCMVLHMDMPSVDLLLKRGAEHFGGIDPEVQKIAADQLFKDREQARSKQLFPLPGQAEFMDLLRALHELAPKDPKKQEELLESISEYALHKHPEWFKA